MDREHPKNPLLLGLSVALALAGCTGGRGEPVRPDASASTYDWSPVLRDTVEIVIVPTYADLADGARALAVAAEALAAAPTDDNLAAARRAWLAARVPWEQSEGFLFGPIAELSLDPALDSWPVDRVQLDRVLASEFELTENFLSESLGGTLKGFHTIEYLLWGTNHAKTAAELTPRELEYLVAAAHALATDAETVRAAWSPDGGGYGRTFYLAGQPGGRYYTQVDAIQQLMSGMIDICDEVANGKIGDPFAEQNVALVESQFAWNSLQDFADNIRSVRSVYTATYGDRTGSSIADFVAATAAALDARLRAEIEAAIAAILAIGDGGVPFRTAIMDPARAPAIEAAQAAIRTIMTTIGRDLAPLIRGR